MSGSIHLYVGDNKVYRIPLPKGDTYKAVPQLANKEVLYTYFVYDTINRKPEVLINFYCDRLKLDNKGQYTQTDEEINRHYHNIRYYGFETVESLSEREGPWVIPLAPTIPSSQEKATIIQYLSDRYPSLAKDVLWVIESYIAHITQLHKETLNMIKEANKLRKIKNNR